MLYSEIIAVCSQIHVKHINTLCGQNVKCLNVIPGGKYSNHWDLKDSSESQLAPLPIVQQPFFTDSGRRKDVIPFAPAEGIL
jgi:hypothetical protein